MYNLGALIEVDDFEFRRSNSKEGVIRTNTSGNITGILVFHLHIAV
jgi:hypothetical protein